MRPDRVEVTPPAFDDDLSLAQRVEDFTVEQFIAKAGVEALHVPVLPRAAWRDVDGLCPDRCYPFLHSPGHELRPIVGSDGRPSVAVLGAAVQQTYNLIYHKDGLQRYVRRQVAPVR